MKTCTQAFCLLLAILLLNIYGVQSQSCCSQCSEIRRDKFAFGLEPVIFESSVLFYLNKPYPYAGIRNMMTNFPSNITEYFLWRSKDVKERIDNNLAAYEIKVDSQLKQTEGVPRISYSDIPPTYIEVLITALNETLTQNIFGQSSDYILYKQRYYDELFFKYKEWRRNRLYTAYPNPQKRANVAAMAVLSGEILTLGPEEQVAVKNTVQSTIQQCFSGTRSSKDLMKCLKYTNLQQKQLVDINRILPGPKGFVTKKQKKYAITARSKLGYFAELKEQEPEPIVYNFKKKNWIPVYEEKTSKGFDWSTTIQSAVEVYKNGDPRLFDDSVLFLVRSITFETLYQKITQIGSISQPEFRTKYLSLSAYNIATVYTPILGKKYGVEFYESMKNSCPATCSNTC